MFNYRQQYTKIKNQSATATFEKKILSKFDKPSLHLNFPTSELKMTMFQIFLVMFFSARVSYVEQFLYNFLDEKTLTDSRQASPSA
jgi:hypothetical protein